MPILNKDMLFRICKTAILVVLLLSVPVFSDTGANHQVKQVPPIKLGTSGGNSKDKTTQFCCSGTLGSLVKDAAGSYILSNNHVLARVNKSTTAEPIIQPGLIDVNCFAAAAQIVAHLSKFAVISFTQSNTVDAALARIVAGEVNLQGKILDIGQPGHPTEPAVGMLVKKSGRTTGLTFGKVIALNVTVFVKMPRFCGDNTGTRAKFVDQFVVQSTTTRHFIDAGDSGSLIVRRNLTCPPAVGLVFAGDNSGNATANRISNVLSIFHVSVVACSPTTANDASSAADLTGVNSAVIQAEAIRERHEDELFRIPGIEGVGIGAKDETSRNPAIVVFVQENSRTATSSTAIPKTLDGLPVKVILTSGFKAL